MTTTTDTATALDALRAAIRAELIAEIRDGLTEWWAAEGAGYVEASDVEGAFADTLITLDELA